MKKAGQKVRARKAILGPKTKIRKGRKMHHRKTQIRKMHPRKVHHRKTQIRKMHPRKTQRPQNTTLQVEALVVGVPPREKWI
jgi:hypothetical protein